MIFKKSVLMASIIMVSLSNVAHAAIDMVMLKAP